LLLCLLCLTAYAQGVEHNPAGSNSDSASPQNHSADEIVSNLKHDLSNLTEFCQLYANEPSHLTPFLCLYTISREFGGHEEGGWYYDWLTPVVCEYIGCVNLDDGKLIEAYKQEMRDSHGAKFQGDPDVLIPNPDAKVPAHWSASPRCATHVLYAEAVPFASVSHTRPHYE
jgi:hypothetical protein